MSNSLTVLSVNLQKSHKDLKTILETTLTDVLLVQEPSWVCLVPRRSDTDLLREDTQGSVNHPQWNALFPPLVGPSLESRPLVTTFLRKSTTSPYVVLLLPSFSSLSSLGITLSHPSPVWDLLWTKSLGPQSASATASTTNASPPGVARENRGATMASAPVAAIMVPLGSAYAPQQASDLAPISPSLTCAPSPVPPFTLQILNFYHHVVCHRLALHPLLSFQVDPSLPMLLCGNFNTHSPLWSPPDVPPSCWHDQLEAWLDALGLISTVPEGAITHRTPGTRPSLIDHIFMNDAFLGHPLYPVECTVSFDYSVSSDHAGLLLSLPTTPDPLSPSPTLGWKIDPLLCDAWTAHFCSHSLPVIMDAPSLRATATQLLADLSASSDAIFATKSPPSPKGLAWWNDKCRCALADTHHTHSDERR